MHFCSWMVTEFYTKKYFVFLLRTNILLPLLSKCFVVKPVCSEVKGWPFQNWLNHGGCFVFSFHFLSPCESPEGQQRKRKWKKLPWLRGCSCRMYQDVLKEKLCCSNSFLCCSLDGQDVLYISVLRAWCFNKTDTCMCNHCVFCFFVIWSKTLRKKSDICTQDLNKLCKTNDTKRLN